MVLADALSDDEANQSARWAPPRHPLAPIKSKVAGLVNGAQAWFRRLDARYQTFVQTQIDPWLNGTARQEQMAILAADTKVQFHAGVSAGDAEINRYIALSFAIVGLAGVAQALFPPLLIVTTAGVVMLTLPAYKAAYHTIRHEKRIKTELVTALYLSFMWLNGYFVFGAFVCLLFFLGLKLAFQLEGRSRQGMSEVFGQQPRMAWRLGQGVEVRVAVAELQAGDLIVVNAGEVFPVDGTIHQGNGSIDQRLLTGEAQPVEKGVGERVYAATLLLAGRVQVVVERAGAETTVAHIGAMLAQTANHQTALETQGMALANRAALPNLLLGLLAYPLRGFVGATAVLGAGFGLNLRTCALISTLNYLQTAAHNMILIKDGRALERLQQVDTVVFDKTGTLTLEQPTVVQIHCCRPELSATQVLTYAAAAEYRQTHPIAQAILSAADAHGLTLPAIDAASYEVGYGIKVTIDGLVIRVGSDRYMAQEAIAIPPAIQAVQDACRHQGHALVMVAGDQDLLGALELDATLRPEVATVLHDLRQRGLTVAIISGDQEAPTRALANALGVDRYYANTLPENKAALVAELQRAGRVVCFIGDGINDAIALKQADVSISLRGATTIATDTAQIVLMDQNLAKLSHLLDLAKGFERTLQQVLWTTLVPGVFCIGGVFFLHFGIIAVELLFQIGFLTGLGVALAPLKNKQPKVTALPHP